MNARRFTFPTLAALFLALGSSSWAWGPVGHKAVAMIAQSRLSPQALKAIAAILGPGVSLHQIASCADDFAYSSNANCAGLFTVPGDPAASKPWHFIDIPVTAKVDATSMMTYCPQDACSVAQIHKDVAVLQNPSAALNDKQVALMFLVHFVGDSHQPLHSETGVPDDRGGNLKLMNKIIYQGKPVNLHAIWDDAMEDPAKVDYQLPQATLTAQAQSLVSSLDGLPVDPSWTTGDLAAEAALEGQGIAQSTIYPAYNASQGNDLLADYQSEMQPIAYRRIKMAGVRLAFLLEQALGSSAPSSASAVPAAAAVKPLSALSASQSAAAIGNQ
jgi:hypothetical protein